MLVNYILVRMNKYNNITMNNTRLITLSKIDPRLRYNNSIPGFNRVQGDNIRVPESNNNSKKNNINNRDLKIKEIMDNILSSNDSYIYGLKLSPYFKNDIISFFSLYKDLQKDNSYNLAILKLFKFKISNYILPFITFIKDGKINYEDKNFNGILFYDITKYKSILDSDNKIIEIVENIRKQYEINKSIDNKVCHIYLNNGDCDGSCNNLHMTEAEKNSSKVVRDCPKFKYSLFNHEFASCKTDNKICYNCIYGGCLYGNRCINKHSITDRVNVNKYNNLNNRVICENTSNGFKCGKEYCNFSHIKISICNPCTTEFVTKTIITTVTTTTTTAVAKIDQVITPTFIMGFKDKKRKSQDPCNLDGSYKSENPYKSDSYDSEDTFKLDYIRESYENMDKENINKENINKVSLTKLKKQNKKKNKVEDFDITDDMERIYLHFGSLKITEKEENNDYMKSNKFNFSDENDVFISKKNNVSITKKITFSNDNTISNKNNVSITKKNALSISNDNIISVSNDNIISSNLAVSAKKSKKLTNKNNIPNSISNDNIISSTITDVNSTKKSNKLTKKNNIVDKLEANYDNMPQLASDSESDSDSDDNIISTKKSIVSTKKSIVSAKKLTNKNNKTSKPDSDSDSESDSDDDYDFSNIHQNNAKLLQLNKK